MSQSKDLENIALEVGELETIDLDESELDESELESDEDPFGENFSEDDVDNKDGDKDDSKKDDNVLLDLFGDDILDYYTDHGKDMPCIGFTTTIKRLNDNPESPNCDYYVHPPEDIIKEHQQVMDGINTKVLRSGPDVKKFLKNISKLEIKLEDDCIEKIKAIKFKGIVANLTPKEKKILNNTDKNNVMYKPDEEEDEEDDEGEEDEEDEEDDEDDEDEEDDDESYYSDSDDESVKKIENHLNKDDLLLYHPETKQINFNELLVLCKTVKDVNGNPIDPLHRTIPILTKYEKSKVLGLRSKQINSGSEPFISVNSSIIDGYTIALMELEQKKIPFIVRRPMPNGTSEYWDIFDLELI